MKQSGFGLTEILVALLIGSLAFMASLQAQWRARQSQIAAVRQHQALEYLNNLCESWLANSSVNLPAPPGTGLMDSQQAGSRHLQIRWDWLDLGRRQPHRIPMRRLRQKP